MTYSNIKNYIKGGYGDIAIRREGGGGNGEVAAVLYGSYNNGQFYRLNLSKLIEADADNDGENKVYKNVDAGFKVLNSNLGLNNPIYVREEVEVNESFECPSPPIPYNGNGLGSKNLQIAFDASRSNLIGQVYSGSDKKNEIDFRGAYYSIANFQNLPPFNNSPSDNSGERAQNPSPSAYYTCYSSPDINQDIEYGFRDLGGSSTERIEPVPPNFGLDGLSADCIKNVNESGVYLAEFNYSITLEDLLVWSLRFCGDKECGDAPATAEFAYELRLMNNGEPIAVEQYSIETIQFTDQGMEIFVGVIVVNHWIIM